MPATETASASSTMWGSGFAVVLWWVQALGWAIAGGVALAYAVSWAVEAEYASMAAPWVQVADVLLRVDALIATIVFVDDGHGLWVVWVIAAVGGLAFCGHAARAVVSGQVAARAVGGRDAVGWLRGAVLAACRVAYFVLAYTVVGVHVVGAGFVPPNVTSPVPVSLTGTAVAVLTCLLVVHLRADSHSSSTHSGDQRLRACLPEGRA